MSSNYLEKKKKKKKSSSPLKEQDNILGKWKRPTELQSIPKSREVNFDEMTTNWDDQDASTCVK